MSKMSFFILLLLLSCRTLFGQTEFHGLTAGKSTRPDVERVLGQPVKEHSEVLVEYQPTQDARARVNKVYVQYRKGSPIVERIEALLVQPLNRSDVLIALHLPQQPTASRTNDRGNFEEYFGPPFYVVLTYEGAEVSSGVARTGRYSRELFESALSKNAAGATSTGSNRSVSGRWSGSWTNSKGESGQSSININEQGAGAISGDEDGLMIENGRRSGNVLTWEYRNQNNGCRDYSVRWEISADGRAANGIYKATDRCEKQTYTGTYLNYRR